jgi:hypothetical protein
LKHLIIIFFSVLTFSLAEAQVSITNEADTANEIKDQVISPNKKRIITAAAVHVLGDAGTLVVLSKAWYKNYPKTSFHTYNDGGEWLQVDKTGHAWTAYTLAKHSTDLWKWTSLPAKKATVLGGISALGFQTVLEYLDAHSAAWGWSWADVGANVFGTSLFTVQDFIWQEQKVQFKFSSFPVRYHPSLKERAYDLYGNDFATRLLKDYNAQTYWLSFNVSSILPKSKAPRWLNLAIGYGAQGMFGGYQNIARDKNGIITFYRPDVTRRRQFFLSPDVDFTKIRTQKKGIKTLLSLMNMIKFPAPALELSDGKIKGHFVSF